MKLVVDMNLSVRWVAALNDAGLPAQHWSQLGMVDAADREIMKFAREQDAVVFTRDLDFSAILAANRLMKPSVVHIRDEDRFDPFVVRRVVMAIRAFSADLNDGAILTIAGNRVRIRLLPI